MLYTAEFWVLVSFVIFVALVGRKVWAMGTGMLDSRAERIRQELDEAQRLREDAQSTLATYQRKQRDALKDAEEIVARAREEAERLRKQAEADLEASLKRREQQAMDRIAQAEATALAEVRNLTVDLAVAASRRLLTEGMDEARQQALVDQAIADLPKALH